MLLPELPNKLAPGMSVTEAFAASKSKEESNSNSKKKQNHWSSCYVMSLTIFLLSSVAMVGNQGDC